MLEKSFIMNQKSVSKAQLKFRIQMNANITFNNDINLIKLFRRFKKIGTLQDHVRSGRPCLIKERLLRVTALVSFSASGRNSVSEIARRLDLPSSSVRNILHGILDLYLHRSQTCQKHLLANNVQRKTFSRRTFPQIEQNHFWLLMSLYRLN